MSREVAKQVIVRTKEDTQFLDALLKNPQKTLEGYHLTEKEIEFFSTAEREVIEGLSESCFELADQ